MRLCEPGANGAKACANSCALPKRYATSLLRQRATTSPSPLGKSGRNESRGRGTSLQIATIKAETLRALNGNSPVSSSYIITPSDQKSVRASTRAASLNCSGEAYNGDPRKELSSVRFLRVNSGPTSFDIPKSITLT
jgi:hypothetical protein